MRRRIDVQEGQRGPQVASGREDVDHGQRRGVGEHAQDLLAQDAVGGAEQVPTGA